MATRRSEDALADDGAHLANEHLDGTWQAPLPTQLKGQYRSISTSSVATYQDREDDLAPALFKVIESQLRGFAHGHGKVHSVLDGNKELHDSFDNVVREIAKLEEASGDGHPADDHILDHLSETTRHATDMPQ